MHDFMDNYGAHTIEKLKASGASRRSRPCVKSVLSVLRVRSCVRHYRHGFEQFTVLISRLAPGGAEQFTNGLAKPKSPRRIVVSTTRIVCILSPLLSFRVDSITNRNYYGCLSSVLSPAKARVAPLVRVSRAIVEKIVASTQNAGPRILGQTGV